jgi:Txe/YoeB family toxin of Txe-Axe toxin-antitoxin module
MTSTSFTFLDHQVVFLRSALKDLDKLSEWGYNVALPPEPGWEESVIKRALEEALTHSRDHKPHPVHLDDIENKQQKKAISKRVKPLQEDGFGKLYSRRIDRHRMCYLMKDGQIAVVACYKHDGAGGRGENKGSSLYLSVCFLLLSFKC